MGFSRQEHWSGLPCPPPGDLPNPGIEPGLQVWLQADSLPSEPPGKSKNIGVGSLSLLQGISLTQESNRGLLNCRWILYQLSYQGSPSALLCPNQNDKSFVNLFPLKMVYIFWNVARYRKAQRGKKLVTYNSLLKGNHFFLVFLLICNLFSTLESHHFI